MMQISYISRLTVVSRAVKQIRTSDTTVCYTLGRVLLASTKFSDFELDCI